MNKNQKLFLKIGLLDLFVFVIYAIMLSMNPPFIVVIVCLSSLYLLCILPLFYVCDLFNFIDDILKFENKFHKRVISYISELVKELRRLKKQRGNKKWNKKKRS